MCLRQLRSCFKPEASVLSNTIIPGLTYYSTVHSLNKKLSCYTRPIECHVNLNFFLSETLTLQTCVLDRVLSEQLSKQSYYLTTQLSSTYTNTKAE